MTRNNTDGIMNCGYGKWCVIILIELGTDDMEGDG